MYLVRNKLLADYCLKAELLPLTGQFIDVYNIIVIQSGYVLKIVVMINCLLILCYAFVNVVGTDILQDVYRRRKPLKIWVDGINVKSLKLLFKAKYIETK
jgi:hypothetical protein